MSTSEHVDSVDPRAPRFGQAITGTLTAGGVVLQEPGLIAVVAVILGLSVLSNWRLDTYAVLWRRVMLPVLGPPEGRETAAPHRFAKVVGAAFTIVATPLTLLGGSIALVGFALAGMVSILALLGATTGFCLGCRMYQEVALFRRLGVV